MFKSSEDILVDIAKYFLRAYDTEIYDDTMKELVDEYFYVNVGEENNDG